MNTKGIIAIAILGLLFASTFAILPAPLVAAQTDTLFDMTVIAPGNANLLRRQWGLIITNSFKAVGINANIVFLGWGSVYDRVLTPLAENIGKTWVQGGWDALEIGWSAGAPGSEMLGAFQTYYGQNTPPASNYFLWQNSSADDLVRTFLVEGTSPEGVAAFKEWQLMQFEDVPASQIMFQSTVFSAVQGVNFNGFDWIFAQLGSVPQFVTGVTSFVLGSTGEPLDMCPPLSNSWYDTIAFAPVYDAMYFIDNDYLYHPSVAVGDPAISVDGYEYTYTLRSGVLFHDDVEVTADDLVFSYLAYLNPNSGSQQSAYIAGFLGNDITFKFLNGTEGRLVIDLNEGTGVYPATTETGDRPARIEAIDTYTIKVTLSEFPGLGAPTALWHPGPDNIAILPMHLLGALPYADWKSSVLNTGTGTATINGYDVVGPVGCGPYVWQGYDAGTSLITETKFGDYWNATALQAEGFFGITDFYVKYIVEKDAAIGALTNNEVQALDPNYQLQADYTAGNLNAFQNWVQTGAGIQQIGYNLRHPIWGTGVDTPNGVTDPANAAVYARYVRQAFDFLIPRELIVDNLMSGIGDPADVHVNPISAFKNTAISPRDYNPTMAKQLLAMAGYDTGVTPPAPTPPPTTPGQAIGMYTVLESSTDGLQWTPVMVGKTDSLGNFLMTYTPPVAGVQYHVISTGLQIQTALDEGITESDVMEYWTLPDFVLSLPVETSGVWTAADTSAMTFAGSFDIAPFDALSIYNATALTNDVNSLNSRLTSVNSTLTGQVSALQTSLNSLQSQVNALSASVGSMSTIAYAGVALAIVALLVAIVAFMKKK